MSTTTLRKVNIQLLKEMIKMSLLLESFHVRCGNSLQVAVHVKQLLVQLVLSLLDVINAVQLNISATITEQLLHGIMDTSPKSWDTLPCLQSP